MDPEYRDFGTQFATAVIARDFDAAQEFLSPWLQSAISPSRLEEILGAAQGDIPPVARFDLDGNRSTYEDLREPDGFPPRSASFDPGLTADNFRQWMCIEFKPSEDSAYEASFDLWMAVVQIEGGLRIGYLEPTLPD